MSTFWAKLKKINWLPTLFVIAVLIAVESVLINISRLGYQNMSNASLFSMVFECAGILVCTTALGGCMVGQYRTSAETKRFFLFIFSVTFSFFCDQMNWATDGITRPLFVAINFLFCSLLYLSNILMVYAFSQYIVCIAPSHRKFTKVYLNTLRIYLCILSLALLFNVKFGFIFTIANGIYTRGPFAVVAFVLAGVLIFGMLPLLIWGAFDKERRLAAGTYVVLPLIGSVLQAAIPGIAFSEVAVFLSVCIMYVHVHVRQSTLLQNELLENERKQSAIMLSQIGPHFLYNTLTSIAYLCDKDPQTAKKITLDFSAYLRGNLDVLKNDTPVPFERELNHITKYLNIEQVRFGERLNVQYDINATDFLLPSLTVQPLVENAVKHGVCAKVEGGTVRIASHETEGGYEVIIRDDGVGFDIHTPKQDGRAHIGIENVRHRLKQVNATLLLESTPGQGTVATIFIPREEF